METSVLFTYEDYKTLPETGPRYQIIEGDLIMTPAPTTLHQRISANIEFLLRQHVRNTGEGEVFDAPVDVILSDTDVVQPDILFLKSINRTRIKKEGIFGPPDLVIEVISPSTEAQDRGVKRKLYARYGVEELWLVHGHKKTIEIYSNSNNFDLPAAVIEGNDSVISNVIPSFKPPLSEIFPRQSD